MANNNKNTSEHGYTDKERYLHGFSTEEQQRLLAQADFLAPTIFSTGPLPKPRDKVIELGCGVGAQTRHICSVDPSVKVVSVDHSPAQLNVARTVLGPRIEQGQVTLLCADAAATGLEAETFDLAYLCWILEHSSHPQDIVREAFRLLKPGATIWVTEVFNSSLQIMPSKPVLGDYWNALNQLQREMLGNPDVGLQLPNLLHKAGFVEIQSQPVVFFYAADKPRERDAMLNYWQTLMLSALPALVKAAKGGQLIPTEMEVQTAFDELKNDKDTVFFYHPIRCVGRKPG
jgi:ubiquinone/menaquinone biosynthesis C-methylase UbiE